MSEEKNWQFELEEYIKQGEPGQIEKVKHGRLQSACRQRTDRAEVENETKEADIVSVRIAIQSNLLLGTNYELKNRYMHVDFVDSLQEKQYIRRVNGSRYGKWEVLV